MGLEMELRMHKFPAPQALRMDRGQREQIILETT